MQVVCHAFCVPRAFCVATRMRTEYVAALWYGIRVEVGSQGGEGMDDWNCGVVHVSSLGMLSYYRVVSPLAAKTSFRVG